MKKRMATLQLAKGFTIDTGLRVIQETTGGQLALVCCAEDPINGWLQDAPRGRLPAVIKCETFDKHGLHRLVTVTDAVWMQLVDLEQDCFGISADMFVSRVVTTSDQVRRTTVADGAELVV